MMRIVGGALFHNGKLLIAKRNDSKKFWPGIWEILGGRVEKGETDEEALIREFYEESKINVKVLKKYHEFRYFYIDDSAIENDFIVSADNFHVVIDPKDHTEFRWVSESEIDDFEMSPDMKESVRKAFKVITNE